MWGSAVADATSDGGGGGAPGGGDADCGDVPGGGGAGSAGGGADPVGGVGDADLYHQKPFLKINNRTSFLSLS